MKPRASGVFLCPQAELAQCATVIARLRHRRLPLLLSLMALLAQLLLPTVHAQAWAQRGGDARLYAYCGQVSGAVAQALHEQISASLAARGGDVASVDPAATLSQCTACASLHAALLVPTPGTGLPLLALAHERQAPPLYRTAAAVQHLRLPPSQAPPLVS